MSKPSGQAAIRAALAESIFGGLFGVPQSPEAKEEYLRRLKEAARVVAAWEAEARNESASNQKEKGWVN